MLICVDGTGASGDADYAVATMGSFVGMIYYGSRLQNRKYYRGPGWTGLPPTLLLPRNLFPVIERLWHEQLDFQVFMTGFRRGAAIVIETAHIMKDHKMEVEALFLFDAVDRSVYLDNSKTSCIPSNVKNCYHAVRDHDAHSRESFGNCGLAMEDGRPMTTQPFFTTHGGMGGVLWGEKGIPDLTRSERAYAAMGVRPPTREKMLESNPITESQPDGLTRVTPAQEKEGSDAVQRWMWGFLRQHSVVA